MQKIKTVDYDNYELLESFLELILKLPITLLLHKSFTASLIRLLWSVLKNEGCCETGVALSANLIQFKSLPFLYSKKCSGILFTMNKNNYYDCTLFGRVMIVQDSKINKFLNEKWLSHQSFGD